MKLNFVDLCYLCDLIALNQVHPEYSDVSVDRECSYAMGYNKWGSK